MNLLILKGFNNYFNRIIKRYDTIADYTSHSDSHYDFSGINFNPNDGITTTHVIGSATQQQAGGPDLVPLAWEHDGNPDYLIAYETEQVGIATNIVIRSRWFITESVRTRNGQYSLKLKRDSIADNLDSLLSCPAFIKKGIVSDDNPLIVNSEGINVNQIKSGETLLKDKTGSAWIVGYMAKNAPAATITDQIPDVTQIVYETIEDIAEDLNISPVDLSNALTENKENTSYFVNDNIEIVMWTDVYWGTNQKLVAGSKNFLNSFTYGQCIDSSHTDSDCPIYTNRIYVAGAIGEKYKVFWYQAINNIRSQIKSNWSSYTQHPFFTKIVYNKLVELENNKVLIYKNGKYFRIKHSNGGISPSGYNYYGSATSAPFSTAISSFVNNWNNNSGATTDFKYRIENRGNVYIYYNELKSNFYLEEVTNDSDIPGISITMSSTRNAIMDQPYDIFAIPFNNTTIIDGANEYEVVGEYAQKAAMALVQKLTISNVYDIQLLPYCPIPEMMGDGAINVTGFSSGYDYDYIEKTNQSMTYVSDTYTATYDSGLGDYEKTTVEFKPDGVGTLTTSDIEIHFTNDNATLVDVLILSQDISEIEISVEFDLVDPDGTVPDYWITWNYTAANPVIKSIIIYPKSNSFSVALDYNLSLKESMKIDSQTDLYRLVSPNYQGSFDFNVAKNGGAVNGFIADCTYKPYTPYIKVAPNFAWLYGTNYGDCRGLICGGDFSIGLMESKWQEFQLNNKNYQNIFNREIQNLDVNQSIQRTQQYVTGGLNIARDTIAGGVAGGLATGSPYGAIAGAAIGGIGSGVGYAMDINLMEKGLQEQRQFSIDKFRMQLGNIQALPYTLTKVGAFNINSKVFPFLEYYTCSEQEKEALRMKIQYEGMTVGIVDILGNYMSGGYVQADLIRNEAIIEDSHLVDDIYIELTKGVYM